MHECEIARTSQVFYLNFASRFDEKIGSPSHSHGNSSRFRGLGSGDLCVLCNTICESVVFSRGFSGSNLEKILDDGVSSGDESIDGAMAFCGELVAMSGWNFANKTMGAQQSKLSGGRRASAALKFWFSGWWVEKLP
jgi:hypothetical protein